MSRRRYNWERSGWLPALEVVECARLEGWRQRHEAAVAAVAEAGESAGALHVALDELYAVVEQGFRELERYFEDEIAEAVDAVAATVAPKMADPAQSLALPDDDSEARKVAQTESKERAKLRPRREALDRDMAAIAKVRGVLNGGSQRALIGGRVLPVVLAQVEEVRDEMGAVAVP